MACVKFPSFNKKTHGITELVNKAFLDAALVVDEHRPLKVLIFTEVLSFIS